MKRNYVFTYRLEKQKESIGKPRLVMIKFVRYNDSRNIFTSRKNLEEKVSLEKSLTGYQMKNFIKLELLPDLRTFKQWMGRFYWRARVESKVFYAHFPLKKVPSRMTGKEFWLANYFLFTYALNLLNFKALFSYAAFTLIYILIAYILLVNKMIYKWPYLYIKT